MSQLKNLNVEMQAEQTCWGGGEGGGYRKVFLCEQIAKSTDCRIFLLVCTVLLTRLQCECTEARNAKWVRLEKSSSAS